MIFTCGEICSVLVYLTSFPFFSGDIKKSSENDQLTGHFQSFFHLFFYVPDPKSEKQIPVNQLIKNSGLTKSVALQASSEVCIGQALTKILNFVSALKTGFPRLLQVNRLPSDFFHKNKDTTNLMLSISLVISTLRAKNFEYSKTCLKRPLK